MLLGILRPYTVEDALSFGFSGRLTPRPLPAAKAAQAEQRGTVLFADVAGLSPQFMHMVPGSIFIVLFLYTDTQRITYRVPNHSMV